MKNIGKVSREWLHQIGIETIEDLRKCGVVATYKILKSQQKGVSLNLLWALEGAIQNVSWDELTAERKKELQREVLQ